MNSVGRVGIKEENMTQSGSPSQHGPGKSPECLGTRQVSQWQLAPLISVPDRGKYTS